MSIYTPKTLDQAKEIASLISDNPRDCLRLHAAFGAHFGGDMAVTQNNAYMLKGKPSLNADAMSGVVRRSGLCRYMVITSWDDTHCTYECARTDEPEAIKHVFTFTMQMAKAQGLTRNRNWQQMPMQMLRARALTMMLRAVYPDAVSGMYSPDEIADNMSMNDDERAQISADSLGEELRTPTRQPSAAPRPSAPPKQHKAIEHSAPPVDDEEVQALQQVARELYEVSQIGDLDEETGEVSDHAWENQDDVQQIITRGQSVKTKADLEVFVCGLWALANKPNNATPDAIDELHKRAVKLGISDARLGIF